MSFFKRRKPALKFQRLVRFLYDGEPYNILHHLLDPNGGTLVLPDKRIVGYSGFEIDKSEVTLLNPQEKTDSCHATLSQLHIARATGCALCSSVI